MFEKKKDVIETTEPVPEETVEPVETGRDAPESVTDYGVYNNAAVDREESDVVITIPIGESVMTIRAPQALIAQNATDAIAGALLRPSE